MLLVSSPETQADRIQKTNGVYMAAIHTVDRKNRSYLIQSFRMYGLTPGSILQTDIN